MKTIKILAWFIGLGIIFFGFKSCTGGTDSDVDLRKQEQAQQEQLLASFAPYYTERMSEQDQAARNIVATVEFKLVGKTQTHAHFLATKRCKYGMWSCSIVLDTRTMMAVMQTSYNGNVRQAEVRFTPNTFGGFNLDYVYEDGTSASSQFIPVWNKQSNPLSATGILRGVANAIGH